jgi:hypothetical protein
MLPTSKHPKKKIQKKEEILVDDVEYLLLVM